jgi:hypothetical protein
VEESEDAALMKRLFPLEELALPRFGVELGTAFLLLAERSEDSGKPGSWIHGSMGSIVSVFSSRTPGNPASGLFMEEPPRRQQATTQAREKNTFGPLMLDAVWMAPTE